MQHRTRAKFVSSPSGSLLLDFLPCSLALSLARRQGLGRVRSHGEAEQSLAAAWGLRDSRQEACTETRGAAGWEGEGQWGQLSPNGDRANWCW